MVFSHLFVFIHFSLLARILLISLSSRGLGELAA
jgi:hypothetical protein